MGSSTGVMTGNARSFHYSSHMVVSQNRGIWEASIFLCSADY